MDKTKPFQIGQEVEYSMSGDALTAERCHGMICGWIRSKYPHLPDANSRTGIYLANGARYYLDRWDGSGHNEAASPECSTPRQITACDKAFEKLLRTARDELSRNDRDARIAITKNNIGCVFPDQVTWGQHESYTCWTSLDSAAQQLVPHMVSRLPYAGSGCLSAYRGGKGFELSQRARHLKHVVSTETTHARAIFCTRIRKSTDLSRETGWIRAHMIAADSHRCPFATYLTFGVTGLMFMIVNEGHRIGRGLELREPVRAVRTISLDPWLKATVPLSNGRQLTALEIQEAYYAECEKIIDGGGFPDWTNEVMRHWRETLDALHRDPLSLATKLDAYLKLSIYDRQLQRNGTSWNNFHKAQQLLARLRKDLPAAVIRSVLEESPRGLGQEDKRLYDRALRDNGLKRIGLDAVRFGVRMAALDLKYHTLGGLFDQLEQSGHVDPVVITAEDVTRAMTEPPPGGRAQVRGELVKKYHQQRGWLCDWSFLSNGSRYIGLEDPFSPDGREKDLSLMTERETPSLRAHLSALLGVY